MANRGTAAIQLAVETTAQAVQIEQETEDLRAHLKDNSSILTSFDAALPRALRLQQELRDKQAEYEQKCKDLVAVQGELIESLKRGPQTSAPDSDALQAIPIVIGSLQKHLFNLTEGAINANSPTVPVLAVAQIADRLHKLFDSITEKGIVEETEEEKKARLSEFATAYRAILIKLRELVEKSQAQQQQQPPDEGQTPSPTAPEAGPPPEETP
jgi:hypothetical protein